MSDEHNIKYYASYRIIYIFESFVVYRDPTLSDIASSYGNSETVSRESQ